MEKINYNYVAVAFKDFTEFEKKSKVIHDFFPELLNVNLTFDCDLLQEIKDNFDEEKLCNDQVWLFPSYEDFAAYEVYDGWYSTLFVHNSQNMDFDFRGAPDLFKHIDFKSLGKVLEASFDTSIHLKLNAQGAVISLF